MSETGQSESLLILNGRDDGCSYLRRGRGRNTSEPSVMRYALPLLSFGTSSPWRRVCLMDQKNGSLWRLSTVFWLGKAPLTLSPSTSNLRTSCAHWTLRTPRASLFLAISLLTQLVLPSPRDSAPSSSTASGIVENRVDHRCRSLIIFVGWYSWIGLTHSFVRR